MRKVFIKLSIVLVALSLAGFLFGCSAQKTSENQGEKSQGKTIKIGVLPIEDNLPFYAAEKDGLFAQEGVQVELVSFPSAMERDAALQAGQIDGQVADLVAVALLKKIGTDVKIASIGLGATPQEGRFAILSSPKSDITDLAQLKGGTLGISQNSIIDYVSDQMLTDQGIKLDDVKKMAIPKMPVRLDMLLSDQINSACLPDPLASLAQAKGAHLLKDDTYKNISQTVFLFRTQVIKENPDEIKAVVRAYGSAGQALTSHPDQYRELFLEKAQIPPDIKDSYQMPTFSQLQLPTEDEVKSVMEWMVAKNLISEAYSYQDLVDPSLLPNQ
ncbi:ABC-type nitrate/sulfonate/bicarbonate transport system, periplasmic component [Desulfosporosinus orientis DSM 765]|uniref:ABC-type nitrate/sulfonate/bicarbonate transport system, periplasmic component n=1 Tax=Desulfosporosinus orientis (strain ATCC 19365 / DSM 765 / NCIMB 8382 / VKM B-1628 / Singapore I) TaxID=768706 RepID=G7WB84_DESOD|nr:MetQ/NlpA family ABC transporter substrate-binding protein [Desulfosporosinus orientis]AET67865.1 ABC-type nitrate/sulfonate/bicarbonate transport system, periplasmic component [Desulfosporosinus orientis DSM 765]